MLQHPLWEKTKLPPRVIAKLNRLSSAERKLYLAELVETYALKISYLSPTARDIAANWETGQTKHLQLVIAEILAMHDLECLGEATHGGVTYNDNTRHTTTTGSRAIRRGSSQPSATPTNRGILT